MSILEVGLSNNKKYYLDLDGNLCREKEKEGNKITQYVIGKELGKGQFFQVVEYKDVESKYKSKAVRKIKENEQDEGQLEKDHQLIAKWPKSEGLVKPIKQLIPATLTTPAMQVMSLYDGDLSAIIGDMSNQEKMTTIGHLITGLSTLHQANLCHGDIKESNVFYRKKGTQQQRFDLADPFDRQESLEDGKKRDLLGLGRVIKIIILNLKNTQYYPMFSPLKEDEKKQHNITEKLAEFVNDVTVLEPKLIEDFIMYEPKFSIQEIKKRFHDASCEILTLT